jgi:hypothetical protein
LTDPSPKFFGHPHRVEKTARQSKNSALPVQAIVRDRDTWIEGYFGFSLDRAE